MNRKAASLVDAAFFVSSFRVLLAIRLVAEGLRPSEGQVSKLIGFPAKTPYARDSHRDVVANRKDGGVHQQMAQPRGVDRFATAVEPRPGNPAHGNRQR